MYVCIYVCVLLLENLICLFFWLVLDTAAGVWLDRNGLVTSSSRTSKGLTEFDPNLELMRRCRHAAASVGGRIYIYGGLKGGKTLKSVLKIIKNVTTEAE